MSDTLLGVAVALAMLVFMTAAQRRHDAFGQPAVVRTVTVPTPPVPFDWAAVRPALIEPHTD